MDSSSPVSPAPGQASSAPAGAYTAESYGAFAPARSIYQDDRRLFHRAEFSYQTVVAVTAGRMAGPLFVLDLELAEGGTASLALARLEPGVLRLMFGPAGAEFPETSELAVHPLAAQPWPCAPLEDPSGWRLGGGLNEIHVQRRPFGLKITRADGVVVFELETESIAGQPVAPPLGLRRGAAGSEPYFSFRIRNDERFFGLGEKWNKVEKSSTRATVWASDTCGSNTTDLSYKSLPLLFSSRGWGALVLSTFRSHWEVGTWSYTAGSCLTEDPRMDLFLLLAPTLQGLLAKYTDLTGRPPVPPKWALGTWLSRCMYENQAQAEEAMRGMRERGIPCDVVHLDPLWMRTHHYWKIGVDACDFERHDAAFPDLPGLWRKWAGDGFATCLWVNPYLPESKPIYAEAAECGFLLRRLGGGWARLSHGEPVGMVDFTNPAARAWWKEHLLRQLRDGAWVLKPDYGDRVPEDALASDGRTGRELHNLYLFHFTETCFQAAQEARGEGFVWRRAGYIGSQRYPGTWAGDTQVTWEGLRCCLRGGLSAGLSGEAFWGSDIGGFVGPAPSPELYVRWVQLGFFSGLTRFHGTSPREPWHYGETAVEVTRRYANLRYALVPYLLACAQEAHRTGLPLMRHLALLNPPEPGVEHLDDQYLLGPDLLVAPVLLEGARRRVVYFPDGTWRHLEDPDQTFTGPRFHEVEAPLERLPVFVRSGAVLPRYRHRPQHLKGPAADSYLLEIHPGEGSRHLCIPETGFTLEIEYARAGRHARLQVSPAPLDLHVHLLGQVVSDLQSDQEGVEWETGRDTVLRGDLADGWLLEFDLV